MRRRSMRGDWTGGLAAAVGKALGRYHKRRPERQAGAWDAWIRRNMNACTRSRIACGGIVACGSSSPNYLEGRSSDRKRQGTCWMQDVAPAACWRNLAPTLAAIRRLVWSTIPVPRNLLPPRPEDLSSWDLSQKCRWMTP